MSTNTNVPLSQQAEAYKLEAEGIKSLYKLELKAQGNIVLYLSPTAPVTWADQVWEEWSCKLTGHSQNSDNERSRPKFTVANPEGVFSLWVGQGALDSAVLTHYEVLTSHIESDTRVFNRRVWVINRAITLTKDMAIFECRSVFDGQFYKIPARAFYPPEYPHVTLQ